MTQYIPVKPSLSNFSGLKKGSFRVLPGWADDHHYLLVKDYCDQLTQNETICTDNLVKKKYPSNINTPCFSFLIIKKGKRRYY
jgi:hypothetical protein